MRPADKNHSPAGLDVWWGCFNLYAAIAGFNYILAYLKTIFKFARMNKMLDRHLSSTLLEMLSQSPAVGLVGPRQVGKSSLAQHLSEEKPSILLDLQLAETRAQLADPLFFFRENADKLVILDEVQRAPELFSLLRPIIDEDRRPGRFLLLGSASPAIMRASSESLTGRIFYSELTPLSLLEIEDSGIKQEDHLIYGGYPQPLLELPQMGKKRWSLNYLQTFINRDLNELGLNTNANEFERLLYLLAHEHGSLFNASHLSKSLRITSPTVQRYVDILEQAFLIRSLRPYLANVKKRLVKSPRIYWRDSGHRHSLLGIDSYNALLLNPALGASWEGYAIEEVCRVAGEFVKPFFYRTAAGAELDLILELSPGRIIAFEFEFSSGPKLSKGTYNAIEDVRPEYTFVVVPQSQGYKVAENIEVIALRHCLQRLKDDFT